MDLCRAGVSAESFDLLVGTGRTGPTDFLPEPEPEPVTAPDDCNAPVASSKATCLVDLPPQLVVLD